MSVKTALREQWDLALASFALGLCIGAFVGMLVFTQALAGAMAARL